MRDESDIVDFYIDELTDHEIYKALASMEKNKEIKAALNEIAETELRHAEYWRNKAKELNIELHPRVSRFKVFTYKLLRRLMGLGIVLKLREKDEEKAVNKYIETRLKSNDSTMDSILMDEVVHEDYFIEAATGFSKKLSNIRDLIYGMSDGLVEVLSAIAGLVPVIPNPLLIGMAGAIVGVAGTLSMSIGAYLGTKAEEDANKHKIENARLGLSLLSIGALKDRAVEMLVKSGIPEDEAATIASNLPNNKEAIYNILSMKEKENINATNSAIYTGLSYLLGAFIVTIPFPTIGLIAGRYMALITAIILMIAAQSISGLITSLTGNTGIISSMARNAGLSLAATAGTFLIGTALHVLAHISVI